MTERFLHETPVAPDLVVLNPDASARHRRPLIPFCDRTPVHPSRRLVLDPRTGMVLNTYDLSADQWKANPGFCNLDGRVMADFAKLTYLASPFDDSKIEKTVPLTGAAMPRSGFDWDLIFSPDGKTFVTRD